MRYYKISSVFLGLVMACALSSCMGCVSVDTGSVGVKTWWGAVDGTLDPGFHFYLGSVTKMSVQTKSYTMSAIEGEGKKAGDDGLHLMTSDGAMPIMDVTVKYHMLPGSAEKVFRTLGVNYEENIIRPDIRSVVPDIAVQYSSGDLYSSKRTEFVAEVSKRLTVQLAKHGFILDDVQVPRVQMPAQVQKAIEAKLAAQQQSEQMQFTLEKERQEAERKRIEAQGIADFQKTVSSGISEQLLQWKGIEATEKLATSENAKVVIVGGGKSGLPIILGQ